ncbi:hypothetical protein LTR10_017169 [Elasticomyces elasticus]|uniref:Uncharacterized protein n=1 Tax=Exophiala sideris TaxID=1016849 RepID=A0ABR0J544_9EURO|nr:hypothetical protein LTR10_017169 [Elasticomyces elasticus]KAK5028475.1 hypothetical protein LTS07_006566 [Exophiala sideris]KAK5035883.1 hypothetical protein LTR13_005453 [Exophiala sideris]KAK5056919.1 hypothetical protein LTR69_007557 [Exophiala sideris]KAK5181326.1 hypothetical protein LTR44_006121 [Eurotiomycetes sp. CCFEE 6388]
MFKRLSRSAYLCLRCQKNLARNESQSLRTADLASALVPRRWQSSAAAAHVEDDDDIQVDRIPQQPPSDAENPGRPKDYKYRRWKPKRTAELGVNSLGKPAEVLILPSRDRFIPRVPEEGGDKDNVRAMVQQALDFEKEPLQLEGLKTNIEQVQSVIGKERGQLEDSEWQALRTHLKKGFSLHQLQRYVGAMAKTSATQNQDTHFMKLDKADLIQHIVQEVWGFTGPATANIDDSKKSVSLRVNVGHEAKLGWFLTDSNQHLKKISEECKVGIDVYRKGKRIKINGLAVRANAAVQKVNRLAKDLKLVEIHLTGAVGNTYRDPALQDRVKAFLKSVEQKYQVYIHLNDIGDHIKLVHDKRPNSGAHAHREVLLVAERISELQKVAVWNPEPQSETTMMPYPNPNDFSWDLYQLPWNRRVTMKSNPQPTATMVSSSSCATQSMVDDIERWFMRTMSVTAKLSARDGLHHDFSVRFGRALFRDKAGLHKDTKDDVVAQTDSKGENHMKTVAPSEHKGLAASSRGQTHATADVQRSHPERADIVPSSKSADTRAATMIQSEPSTASISEGAERGSPRFVGDIPYLTQLLAPMQIWVPRRAATSGIDSNARAILRLELAPTPNSSKAKRYPSFEMFITVGEEEKPRLTLASLSAIHKDQSFVALCPGQEVDVKFRGRLLRKLWYQGAEPTRLLAPMLKGVRDYIGKAQAQGVTQWLFSPFVTLSMHRSLAREGQAVQVKVADATAEKVDLPLKHAELEKTEYVLQTVDVMDVDSRVVTVSTHDHDHDDIPLGVHQLCLENVTLTGANTTRQELRLAEGSVLYTPKLAAPKVRLLARTALEMSRWLGHDHTKTSLNPLHQGMQLPREFEPDVKTRMASVSSPGKKSHNEPVARRSNSEHPKVDEEPVKNKAPQLAPQPVETTDKEGDKHQQGVIKAAEKSIDEKPKRSTKSRAWKKKN